MSEYLGCHHTSCDSSTHWVKEKATHFLLSTYYFPRKLAPLETTCMKCQNPFSVKNKKKNKNFACCLKSMRKCHNILSIKIILPISVGHLYQLTYTKIVNIGIQFYKCGL